MKIQYYPITSPAVAEMLTELCKKTKQKVDKSAKTMRSSLYKYFVTDDNAGLGCGFSSSAFENYGSERISLEDLVEWLKGKPFKPVSVVLNSEYSANILEDGSVKVGCQTFSAETILDLAGKVKKVLEKEV